MLKKFTGRTYLYWILLTLAIGAFLIQAFIYAHQLPSRVDEGSFLIKGYYYVTGKYQPFQDYGPWTNNMPLAYYIPGVAQAIFGAGLRTGRYFAIFLTLLNFTALWLLIFRLKGKWWALIGILPLAINPSLIATYSQAISEGIVACLFSWTLYFLIGEKRKNWQIATGAFLGAITVLTRQNMIFLVPLVVFYAFWQHGKRAGWISILFSGLPLLTGHAIFYPDILTLWFVWLPGFIRTALGIKVLEGGGSQVWRPEVDIFTRINSFFITFRYHFFSLMSIFASLTLLTKKEFWNSRFERKLVFLLTLFFIFFFGIHAWASLGKNYCVFCLSSYIAFFLPLAVVAGTITLSNVFEKTVFPTLPFFLFSLVFIPGLFLGNLETVGRWIMRLPFPRLKGGQVLSGSTELWKIFSNRFGWNYDQLLPLIAPAFGLMFLIIYLGSLTLCYLIFIKKRDFAFGKLFVISLFLLGIALTPTYILGKDLFGNACGGDVLASYENVGKDLESAIPPGSTVYWSAGSVVTPLLYIPEAQIHPPQLNGIYSARRGGDRLLLEKDGYYNEESRILWRESDDFILVSNTNMVEFWREFLDPELFDEYRPTHPLDPCDPESTIRIFIRKK